MAVKQSMMTYYQINSRAFSAYLPMPEELSYEKNKNYLFDLSYLASIAVVGEKASDFLQGQLSCDLCLVDNAHMRQGVLCNLKGRILALLDVLDWKNHGFHLVLPKDLVEETQRTLMKTALLSRVTIENVPHYKVFGFFLQNPDDLYPINLKLPTERYDVVADDNHCCYYLGHDFYIILVHTDAIDAMQDPFIQHSQWRGSLLWHALALQDQRIELYKESRGLFLPHRLGLHLTGHLSFNKGCYKGQEIIARMHYRSTIKHQLIIAQITTDKPLQSGQPLFAPDTLIEVGELVDYCPMGNDHFLIATSLHQDAPLTLCFEGQDDVVTLTSEG